MALRLNTGIPGTGKTLYMVRHVAKKYCDLVNGEYVLKEGFEIITNIEDFKLPHRDFEKWMIMYGVLYFFTKDSMKLISDIYASKGIRPIFIIDEAADFFPNNFKDYEVQAFFRYHRHYGLDIFLVTQDQTDIPKWLVNLCEFEIRGVPRSVSLFGLNYSKFSRNKRTGGIWIWFPSITCKKFFALYKSMEQTEFEKTPHAMRNTGIAIFVIFGICFMVFKTYVYDRWRGASGATTSMTSIAKTGTAMAAGVPHGKSDFASLPQLAKYTIDLSSIIETLPNGRLKVLIVDPFTGRLVDPKRFNREVDYTINEGRYQLTTQVNFDEFLYLEEKKNNGDKEGRGGD